MLNKKKNAGFTLVEVLIAVGIVGFTIPALMFLMMKQADYVGSLKQKTIASWIAENTTNRLLLEHTLNGSILRGPIEEKVEMAGVEWLVLSEPEATEAALVKYTTTVSFEQDNTLATLNAYVNLAN